MTVQDRNAIPADEAGEWLREHFRDDPEPRIDITWQVGEPSPLVYREVMEILFGPPAG